jgi:heat shock protein HslJ
MPAGKAPRNTDLEAILNCTWHWVATIAPVKKITVQYPERYTIRLNEDGKGQIRFDCNRGGGTYEISGGRLSFVPMLSTRMACPPDSLDAPFIRDLQRIVSFLVEDGMLYLELQYGSGTEKFRPEW